MISSGSYPVVLDACVLIPVSLCDLFLRLAEEPAMYRPRWSQEILDEVSQNQPRATKMSPERVESWQAAVKTAFPEAMVVGYHRYLPDCKNDAKDQHVLAAAIASKTHTIVTFDLAHFPDHALTPYDVVATHPSDYLSTLYDHNPGRVVRCLFERAERRGCSFEELLAIHEKCVPAFVQHVREKIGL